MATRLEKKQTKREQRKRRIRAKVTGSATRPRLSVFRSNRYVSAQIVDDEKGVTVAASSSKSFQNEGTQKERARKVGADIAKKAQAKDVNKVVFDRSGYRFTGTIKELAEGAREGGLIF